MVLEIEMSHKRVRVAMALDQELAAATVFMEARGGGPALMGAVANVLKNRAAQPHRFGATLAAVCLAPHQFSCWQSAPNLHALALSDERDPAWLEANGQVQAALNDGTDFSDGATHYFDPSIAPPNWAQNATLTVEIEGVKFYKNVS